MLERIVMAHKKLNLLVLPILFPREPGDMLGIFVVDYLTAVAPHCNVTVLDLQVSGRTRGLREERMGEARVVRYSLVQGPKPGALKPLLYLLWLYHGWRLARSLGPFDVIHAHGSTLTGNLALLLRSATGTPVVVTEHSSPYPRLRSRGFSRWLTRRALEGADLALFVSMGLQQELAAFGIAPRRAEVSYNPVDTGLFDIRNKTPLIERRNILFVGRIEPFKGALRAVQAFRAIASSHPGWTMTVVGEGPELAAVRSLVSADEALRDRVRLPGQLDKVAIAQRMNEASFLILPSQRETFGLVVAEAMACGLPVIIGENIGAREYVGLEAGLAVPAADTAAIATAMERMVAALPGYDPARIRAGVVERFGFEVFGSRMRDLYRSLEST